MQKSRILLSTECGDVNNLAHKKLDLLGLLFVFSICMSHGVGVKKVKKAV